MSTEDNTIYFGPVFMKCGAEILPAPELMTEDEAIQFLRLDIDGPANPEQTLRYYRNEGILRDPQA